MAITVQSSLTISAQTNTTSLSWTDNYSGSPWILVVLNIADSSATDPVVAQSSITNGTLVKLYQSVDANTGSRVTYWLSTATASTTSGSTGGSVTFQGTCTDAGGSVLYLTNTIGDVYFVGTTGYYNSSTGTGTAQGASISVHTDRSLLVGALHSENRNPNDVTLDGTATSVYHEDYGNETAAIAYEVHTSTGTKSISWTDQDSDDWAASAIELFEVTFPTIAINTTDNGSNYNGFPTVEFTGTLSGVDLEYEIQWDIFTSFSTPEFIAESSVPDAGFANTVTPADTHPFNSAEKISYTVQSADQLDIDTWYWRVRAIDVSHPNIYSDWSAYQTINVLEETVTVTPVTTDGFEFSTLTPTLDFSGNSSAGSDIEYQVKWSDEESLGEWKSVALYDETNQSGTISLDGTSITYVGQSFKPSQSGTLYSMRFRLRKVGSPTGSIRAFIYSYNAGIPDTQIFGSDTISASELTTSYQWYEFDFGFDIGSTFFTENLDSSTDYYAACYYNGDTTNYVEIGIDNTSPTHSGTGASYDSPTWTQETWDAIFEVKVGTPMLDGWSYNLVSVMTSISNSVTMVGQTFKPFLTRKLQSVYFVCRRTGNPTNYVARIRAHTGTYGTDGVPTGSILAESVAPDLSWVTTLGQDVVEFKFAGSNQIELTADTAYCVVIYGIGTDSNNLKVGYDANSPTHGGNRINFTTVWNSFSSSDMCFSVVGIPTALGTVTLKDSSVPDTGFANNDTPVDTHPFNDEDEIGYTIQSGDALTDGTYYWAVKALLSANESAWSTKRSFIVSEATGGMTLDAITLTFTESATLIGKIQIASSINVNFTTSCAIVAKGAVSSSTNVSFTTDLSVAGKSLISTSSDVDFTTSATILGLGELSASENVNFTTSGSIGATAFIDSSINVNFTTSADGHADGLIESSVNVNFTTPATLVGTGEMIASENVNFTTSATILGSGLTVSISVLNFTTSGTIVAKGQVASSIDVDFTESAVIVGNGEISGTETLTFTESGVLIGTADLASSINVAFTTDANLTSGEAVEQISGTTTLNFTTSQTLVGKAEGIGEALLSFSVTGVIVGKGTIEGQESITFTESSTIVALGSLTGQLSNSFSTSAEIGGSYQISGSTSLDFETQITGRGKGKVAGISNVTQGSNGQLKGKGHVVPLSGSVDFTTGTIGTLLGDGLVASISILDVTSSATLLGKGLAASISILDFATELSQLNSTQPISGESSLTFDLVSVMLTDGEVIGETSMDFTSSAELVGKVGIEGSTTLDFTSSTDIVGKASLLTVAGTLNFVTDGTIKAFGSVSGESDVVISLTGQSIGYGSVSGALVLNFSTSAFMVSDSAIIGSTSISFSLPDLTLVGFANMLASTTFTFSQALELIGKARLEGSTILTFDQLAEIGSISQILGSTEITFGELVELFGRGNVEGDIVLNFASQSTIDAFAEVLASTQLDFSTVADLINGSEAGLVGTTDLDFVTAADLKAFGELTGTGTSITFSQLSEIQGLARATGTADLEFTSSADASLVGYISASVEVNFSAQATPKGGAELVAEIQIDFSPESFITGKVFAGGLAQLNFVTSGEFTAGVRIISGQAQLQFTTRGAFSNIIVSELCRISLAYWTTQHLVYEETTFDLVYPDGRHNLEFKCVT